METTPLAHKQIQTVYRNYSSFYDYVFGYILQHGRRRAVEIVNKAAPLNTSILDVGVGTGLSLFFYREDLKVTGIDLCKEMLEKAEKRVQNHNMQDRVKLIEMDAEHLQFPDNAFHSVIAMHVASVVNDPHAFLNELLRVCVPGGDIIIVNHFSSKKPWLQAIEKKLAAFHFKLGFNLNLSMQPFLTHPGLKLIDSQKTNFLGWWKLLHFRKVSE